MDGPNIIIIVCSALSLILRTIVLFKDFRHSQTTNGYQPLNAILLINGTLFKQFLVIGMIDDINYILGTVAPESIKNGFNAFCIISTIVSTYASLSEMFLAFFIFFIYAYTVQYRDITFMDRYGKLVYAFSYLTPLLLVSILFFYAYYYLGFNRRCQLMVLDCKWEKFRKIFFPLFLGLLISFRNFFPNNLGTKACWR